MGRVVHVRINKQTGVVTAIHDDDLMPLLREIGTPETSRASDVEPQGDGTWTADLTKSGGPVLAGFARRDEAIEAELAWLRANVLKVND